MQTECRDPAEVGPVRQRTLTWQTVLAAIQRIGVPASQVRAPAYTLVNLETTFWTRAETIERSLSLIGFAVDVEVTPTSYTWHWGDGSSSTTQTPGRPYPSTDVTHTYVHATRHTPPLALSVDTTFTARYRVDDGPWQTIPQSLVIAGPATTMPVREATAVLVAND
jgi:hypothetical protein